MKQKMEIYSQSHQIDEYASLDSSSCYSMWSRRNSYFNIIDINREWKMQHPTKKTKPRGSALSIRGTKVMRRYACNKTKIASYG